MDQFLLDHTAQYQALVRAVKPVLKRPAASVGATPSTPHNSNIVVSARIRPLLPEDILAGFPCAIFPRSAQSSVVDIHELYHHPRGRPTLKSFDYEVDRLFSSETTTEEIYEGFVASLIPFSWDDGIGTVFAYGQTGSGKTFTVDRLQQLVAKSLMNGSLEGRRQVYITIIELAGNLASDLLNDRKPISVLEDSFGVTHLAGAEEHLVRSEDEILDLTERAATLRRTEATSKNDASSRSHVICRIRIRNPCAKTDGLLYLVDLAGSEAARDVARHGAARMRETKEINMSLSVLKDCIRNRAAADILALSGGPKPQRTPHIPIRQSALTKVLKHVFDPSSGRPSRTVVIACVNPSLADTGPSKNTLRYAEMLRAQV